MHIMICEFDAYAASGHHHHIATLGPGVAFRGVYLITNPPTVLTRDNEDFYSFTVSDLTGRLHCLVPVHRVLWQQHPEFQSQRVLIEGNTTLVKDDLTALVRDLEPVRVIW
jgi:hypothetical protein